MKRRIASVALVGAMIGVCWVMVLGATQLQCALSRGPWQALMLASCPPLAAIQTGSWLVPIINGLIYAAIGLSIQFFRKFLRPFAN